MISPRPSTRRHARSVAEKLGSALPEPWVPVAIAPAMACVSMSPWLASASPAAQSGSPNAPTGVPGSAVTRRRAASMCATPLMRLMSSTVPPVSISGVNEWPAPAARTPLPFAMARRTCSTTSSSPAGVTTPAVNDWLPAQFVQVVGSPPAASAQPSATTAASVSWMIAVTSSGRERNGEWLASMRLTVPACCAMSSCSAGGIALSRSHTT